MGRYFLYTFRLSEKDKDLIQLLSQTSNRSELIRNALRLWLNKDNLRQEMYEKTYSEAVSQQKELIKKIEVALSKIEKKGNEVSKSEEKEQFDEDKLKAEIRAGALKIINMGQKKDL